MGKKNWVAAATLAGLGALTMSLPAAAGTSVALQVGMPAMMYVAPPPAPVYEAVPVGRRGYIWVAGHYEWNGNRHIWVQGHYLRERAGYYYEPAVWVQTGDRWGYRAGHWGHGERGRGDRDHDGVPNRHDRDRDGDGVPNNHDRAPNNPNRR